MSIAEREALALVDGQHFESNDVQIDAKDIVSPSRYDLTHYRATLGRPISLKSIITDSRSILSWLDITTDHLKYTEISDSVAKWQEAIGSLPPSPVLLHSAAVAYSWHRHRPTGQGDLVAGLLLGDRWGPGRWLGSSGGLTALGLSRSNQPWKHAKLDDFREIWIKAIATGAKAHLDLEIRLRAFWVRAEKIIRDRNRPGRLEALIQLAMSRPQIDGSAVANALDLTSAGAIKILTLASDLGLLIERTGGASYRRYSIPVSSPAATGIAISGTEYEEDLGNNFDV